MGMRRLVIMALAISATEQAHTNFGQKPSYKQSWGANWWANQQKAGGNTNQQKAGGHTGWGNGWWSGGVQGKKPGLPGLTPKAKDSWTAQWTAGAFSFGAAREAMTNWYCVGGAHESEAPCRVASFLDALRAEPDQAERGKLLAQHAEEAAEKGEEGVHCLEK